MINRNKIIRVVAKKRQYKMGKAFLLSTFVDYENGGKTLTGLELLNKDEMDALLIESPDIREIAKQDLPVRDGMNLDLKVPFELLTYLRCLMSSDIANTPDKATSNDLFYLFDEEREADAETEKVNISFEALTYIADKTENELRDIAIYLGIDVRNTKSKVYIADVKKRAMSEPEIIIKFKNAPNKERILFAHKLLAFGILERNKDGYFYHGDYLGMSIDGVIATLSKKGNESVASKLSHALASIEDPGVHTKQLIVDDDKNDDVKKALSEKDDIIKISKLQLEYYKLTGTDYDGPMTLTELKHAIDIEKTVSDFKEKMVDADEVGVKKSLKMRGVDSSLFDGEISKEELLKLGEDFIRTKKEK